MSMPRAAMSVATSARMSPLLKPASAWVRADWLLLPCRAMAVMPFLFQELGHVVGAELGAGEHQHLAPVVFLDDVRQQGFFLAATDRVDQLRDALHRGVARRDLHALRVFQQGGGQFADFVAEGGREQQALLVAWAPAPALSSRHG